MKKLIKFILPFMIASVLCSCSGDSGNLSGTQSGNSGGSSSQSESKSDLPEDSGDKAMAVLSINTVNTEKNAIDFVTKPVAPHVSEQIASWTPGYRMPPAPYYENCTITLKDNGNTLLDNTEAEVKVRGNWTTTYDKKPLRIKFAEKQNMAGLNDGAQMKNWVLIAEYKDASMLRNKATFQIAEEILGKDGFYVSDSEFVEVYINEQY